MTETGPENTTEPRLEAASGHSGSFLIGLFGGALIGTAAGVFFASQINAAVRNLRRQLTDAAAGCQRRRIGKISSGHDAGRRRGRRSSAEGPGSPWESAERGRTRRGGCQGASSRGSDRAGSKRRKRGAPTGDARTEFHISKPDGWPTGKYKLEVFLNGSSAATREFEVER